MARRDGRLGNGGTGAMNATAQAKKLYAATVTPMTSGGTLVDEPGIVNVARFLGQAAEVDGLFICGTTGEGLLLSVAERQTVAELYRSSFEGELIVHCGAQTTDDTITLSRHAASIDATGVAVIPPPYYPLDRPSLVSHLVAAAEACADTPFYLYSFAARSGYPLPIDVVETIQLRAPNLAGLKVSDASMEVVDAYLTTGLPVFIGAEHLITEAIGKGAAGAVSGLAGAFPKAVARLVGDADATAMREVMVAADMLGTDAFCAALKHALRMQGVELLEDVRAPLRPLATGERRSIDEGLGLLERHLLLSGPETDSNHAPGSERC